MVSTKEEMDAVGRRVSREPPDPDMEDKSSENQFENGLKFYEQLRPHLLTEHEGDAIFIDCVSGEYVVQGKKETRFDAEARLLKKCPDAEVFMDHIVSDDFAYSLPAMTSR